MKAIIFCDPLPSEPEIAHYQFRIQGLPPETFSLEVRWHRTMPDQVKRIDLEHLIINAGYPVHFFDAMIAYMEKFEYHGFPTDHRAVEVFW